MTNVFKGLSEIFKAIETIDGLRMVAVMATFVMATIGAVQNIEFITLIVKNLDGEGYSSFQMASSAAGIAAVFFFGQEAVVNFALRKPRLFQWLSITADVVLILLLWTDWLGLQLGLIIGILLTVFFQDLWTSSKSALECQCIRGKAMTRLSNNVQKAARIGSLIGAMIGLKTPISMEILIALLIAEAIFSVFFGTKIIKAVQKFVKEKRVFEKWAEE